MKASVGPPHSGADISSPWNGNEEMRKAVLEELEQILTSACFRSAVRSRQFLKFVVEQQLSGHPDVLKERTIGTEVFRRPAGYATGNDPVVRVQAGEVRRKLEHYYQTVPHGGQVRIEVPVGSYSPIFHFSPASPPPVPAAPGTRIEPSNKRRPRLWALAALCAFVALAGTIAGFKLGSTSQRKTILEDFWNPVFSTRQPVLICLSKGITYRPGKAFYDRYTQTHPDTYKTEVERFSIPPQMDPNQKILWGDMEYLEGYGVAIGDVSSALKFSTLLGHLGKPNQVRIGSNYSFEDLRNSPAIVIGAFNNRWTMELLANLRIAFVTEKGEYAIREQVPGGRIWMSAYNSRHQLTEDYGIVARLLDSKTGQFTVAAAGLRDSGTQAAGELASNPASLSAAFHDAPESWQKKNVEIILKTTITDSVPGPPQVVTTYYW